MSDEAMPARASEQPVAPADAPAEATEPTDPTDVSTEAEDTADGNEDRPRNREAQYRIRAREAEAQRDELAGKLAEVQRRLVLDAVGARLHEPGAVLDREGGLGDLVGPDGYPDPAKVDAAVAEVLEAKPYLSNAPKPPTLRPGRRGMPVKAPSEGSGMAGIFRGISERDDV